MKRKFSLKELLANLIGQLTHGKHITENNDLRVFEIIQEAAILLRQEDRDTKKHHKILRELIGDLVCPSDRSRKAKAAVISACLGQKPGDMKQGALQEFIGINEEDLQNVFNLAAKSLGG